MAEARPEETANAARPLSVLPVDDLPSRPSGVEHVRLLRSQGRRRRRRARAATIWLRRHRVIGHSEGRHGSTPARLSARGLRSYPRIASRAPSPPAVQGWPHNTPTDRRAQATQREKLRVYWMTQSLD